jgi:hypothetical protein
MPNKPNEMFSTSDTLASVKYQQATGFKATTHASTVSGGVNVRTVVTTAQKGVLDLRYAPRSPKSSDKNTAL